MPDHDDRRERGWQDYPRQGSGSHSDEAHETYGKPDGARPREPSHEDTAAAQTEAAQSGRGHGQGDDSPSAQRSPSRKGFRYGDSGQAGRGGSKEQGAGGAGGHSGYGSSGQGSVGPGGFARGGYGASGYGGDFGQDAQGGAEPGRPRGKSAPKPD